jgi:uncharacterized protein YndB with AHSA1/START domain
MKWALIAIVAIVAIVAIIAVLALTKPATVSVSRVILIRAPAPVVFGLIDDFHNWPQWAPQDREDKTMIREYSGAPSGVGAISTWTSKGSAGAGTMEIVKAEPNWEVEVKVDFRAPFVAHNVNIFRLEALPDGEARVTWSMHGTNIFLMKVMSVFVSPDSMMGPHFENGLAALKSAAESSAQVY